MSKIPAKIWVDPADDGESGVWTADRYPTDVAYIRADIVERVVALLRDQFCPRPCNGRPDQFDVGDCVDAMECGCGAGAALATYRKEISQ